MTTLHPCTPEKVREHVAELQENVDCLMAALAQAKAAEIEARKEELELLKNKLWAAPIGGNIMTEVVAFIDRRMKELEDLNVT